LALDDYTAAYYNPVNIIVQYEFNPLTSDTVLVNYILVN